MSELMPIETALGKIYGPNQERYEKDMRQPIHDAVQGMVNAVTDAEGRVAMAIENADEAVRRNNQAVGNAIQAANDARDEARQAATRADGVSDLVFSATEAVMSGPANVDAAAEMTDTSKIYVYHGAEAGYTTGDWYYYNGTAWISGGAYNAIANGTITDAKLIQSGGVLSEVHDTRVGADGTIYQTAGDAVRGQIIDLKSTLSEDMEDMGLLTIKRFKLRNGNSDGGKGDETFKQNIRPAKVAGYLPATGAGDLRGHCGDVL